MASMISMTTRTGLLERMQSQSTQPKGSSSSMQSGPKRPESQGCAGSTVSAKNLKWLRRGLTMIWMICLMVSLVAQTH